MTERVIAGSAKTSTHRPKTAALLAYHAGRLSKKGRARLEAHLALCDICRRELAAIRAYESLTPQVRETPEETSPDWTRMERVLEQEAKAAAAAAVARKGVASRRIAPALISGVLAAAAAMAIAINSGETRRDHPASGNPTSGGSLTVAALPIEAEVTLVGGEAYREGLGGREPLAVGSSLEAGDTLHTGHRSEVHLRAAVGTGLTVGDRSELRVRQLERRGDATRVELDLVRGSVTSAVHALRDEERYLVRADRWTVEVRGTHFRVDRTRGIDVNVTEGEVWIYRDGRLRKRLVAPARFAASGTGETDLAAVHGLAEAAPDWPTLVLDGPEITEWEVGGVRFPVGGRLSMRTPPGEVMVVGWRNGEAWLRRRVLVEGAHVFVEAGAPLAERSPVRWGTLAPELIAPVVRAGMRRFQGCHRRLARGGTSVWGRFTLHLTIMPSGAVRAARLEPVDRPAPEPFQRCVLEEARRWVFPSPRGGAVQLAQPLRFTTRF